MRFTWHPASPLPYESAWMVFAKLIALNYCRPKEIISAIAKKNDLVPKYLNFRDSSWIDLERFARMLGVERRRLNQCFLDQLGFPRGDPQSGAGIRFCRECLAKSYHSVFFDLGIIGYCPIHNIRLEDPCTDCLDAVKSVGLHRSIFSMDESYSENFVYYSDCRHIRFYPDKPIWETDTMTANEIKKIRREGVKLIQWWGRVFSSPGGLAPVTASLARISIHDEDLNELRSRIGIAEEIAGPCPWRLRFTGRKSEQMCWNQPSMNRLIWSKPEEMRALCIAYKGVRRHIYRRYVKQHRRCWGSLSNLSWYGAKTLSSDSVCSMALAYGTWRMCIEGFSNIEKFKKNRPLESVRIMCFPSYPNLDILANMNFWYAYFFYILGKIDESLKIGDFYIERFEDDCIGEFNIGDMAWGIQRPLENTEAENAVESCWLVIPQREKLVKDTRTRCFGRTNDKSSMLDVGRYNSVSSWAWNGNLSEYNRPRCMFRIVNSAIPRSSGNTYMYLTF